MEGMGKMTTKTPKIMVVDDEAHIRLLFTEEFHAQGYEVIALPSPAGIISQIKAEHPDVVAWISKIARS